MIVRVKHVAIGISSLRENKQCKNFGMTFDVDTFIEPMHFMLNDSFLLFSFSS